LISKEKKTKIRWLAPFFGVLILVLAAWIWMRMEGETPVIRLNPELTSLGVRSEITVSISDAKSGLSRAWVGLVREGKEQVLHQEQFPSPGFFAGTGIREKTIPLVIEPKKLSLSDGKATLRILVRDRSWRHWFHGNAGYLEKEVTVDTRPPQIIVLSRFHYLNQGGTGLVVYRLTEPCPETGVKVGDRFFPGYGGHSGDPLAHVAFFALSFDQGPETGISIVASDGAGNMTKAGFSYQIKGKRFRRDVIPLSDSF